MEAHVGITSTGRNRSLIEEVQTTRISVSLAKSGDAVQSGAMLDQQQDRYWLMVGYGSLTINICVTSLCVARNLGSLHAYLPEAPVRRFMLTFDSICNDSNSNKTMAVLCSV